jgi:hypothetical protein
MNKRFLDVVETLDHLEVCRITIQPNGKFTVPNEKDGKISLLPTSTRRELASFARAFADRLECPNPKHVTNHDTRTPKRRMG